MTKEELLEQLNYIVNPNNTIGLVMYIISKLDEQFHVAKADLDEGSIIEFRDTFINSISRDIINKDNLELVNISQGHHSNDIFLYDIEEIPYGLELLREITSMNNIPLWNFNYDDFDNIFGFIFLIGDAVHRITIFKKHYPISTIKRDSVLLFKKSNTRFTTEEEDIIKINDTFEFMQIEENLIVTNPSPLERFFDFDEMIKNEANLKLPAIQESNILEDISQLTDIISDKRLAKKLMKINVNSPVLSLPFPTIKSFIESHPKLMRRIKFNAAGTRISLDSNISKELFLKLLDDDFLKSDLTNFLYDSENKNVLTNAVEV